MKKEQHEEILENTQTESVFDKIKKLEKQGRFNEDVEDDPVSKELFPNEIDYTNKKLSSKIKSKIANGVGTRFFNKMIKTKQVIINKPNGLENFDNINGAIITCNHFNIFDNYALLMSIRPILKRKPLWKVIKEGNYTNSPAGFGFILRNCNTLPLSRNLATMKKFLTATKQLLQKGEKILIYPEQSMWRNYQKPRPLKDGAFEIAVLNNVPIVPCFITLKESDLLDNAGEKVLEYTINVLTPIYPNSKISKKENVKVMKEQNFEAWKNLYEKHYNKPLKYGDE